MSIGIILVIAALIGIDQLSKIWATTVLSGGRDILIWPDVFHLHYIANPGAAWGMLAGKRILLVVVTSAIIIGMIVYYHKLPMTKWGKQARFSFVLIIAGAIGNLIDRIFMSGGCVRDFFYFIFINFPIFNVADIWVVAGVILLMVVLIFGNLDEPTMKEE